MSKIWRTCLIDDERLARQDMKSLLKEHPMIKIIGEADNVNSAVSLIEKERPDLLFLDIQMPGETGFDLLNRISYSGRIIFVTAYDEYAIRAFDMNALDYLLKPVNPERLSQSIERLNHRLSENIERKLAPEDRLFLMIDRSMCFIRIEEITSITASGDYTTIKTSKDVSGLTNKSMKEWEHRLPGNLFARIHRSTIVNLDAIARIEEWFHNSYHVYIKDDPAPLVMSRRFAAKLKQRLG
ncbi:response regulator transcription factor [bacterium]|nr:response regulator transcription factor [bacterium]